MKRLALLLMALALATGAQAHSGETDSKAVIKTIRMAPVIAKVMIANYCPA